MSLTFLLYLCDVVSSIDTFLCLICGVFFVIFIIIFILSLSSLNEDENKFVKSMRGKLWIGLLVAIVSLPIPSKQTMYLMLGASYLENSKLPAKVSKALELKIDSVIDELTPKKKKEN